jgi:hypothetical protein
VPNGTLLTTSGETIFKAKNLNAISLYGLRFWGGKNGNKISCIPRVALNGPQDRDGGWVSIQNCSFPMSPMPGIELISCSGMVQNVIIAVASHDIGLVASEFSALTISQCLVEGGLLGISAINEKNVVGSCVTISGNHVRRCKGAAIAVKGNAIVTGNQVAKSGFGLRLGRGGGGHILASNNLIRECDVGIGVAASGETIFASLNLINAPKNGGVRALDGNKLIGPDLTQKSAEAYMNLTLGGNVVR